MAIITKIETQQKNQERCNLFLDNEFYSGVSKLIVLKNNLREGQQIDEKKLKDIILSSEREKAFTWAVDYICKYLPVEKQIKNKLYEKKYHKDVVDYVIDKCKEYGYINDFEFAKSYVYQSRNIKGKMRIKTDLIQKGISSEIIDEVLEEYVDEDGCLTQAKKRLRDKDISDNKVYLSLLRYLQYRGYSYDEINRAIAQIKEEQKDD